MQLLLISFVMSQVPVLQVDNSGYCIDAQDDVPFAMGCNTLLYSASITSPNLEFGIERGIGSCLAAQTSGLSWAPCPMPLSPSFLWKNSSGLLESKSIPGKCVSYIGRNAWAKRKESNWNKLILDDCSKSAPINLRLNQDRFPPQFPRLDPIDNDEIEFQPSTLVNSTCYSIHTQVQEKTMFFEYNERFGLVSGSISESRELNGTLEIQRLFRANRISDRIFQLQLDTRCLAIRNNEFLLDPCLLEGQQGSSQALKVACLTPSGQLNYNRDFCSISGGSNCVIFTKQGINYLK
jgi:hypothetical protein